MNEVTDSPFAISYPEYPLCQGMYHSCMAADSCESGTICTLSMTNKPCCTAPGSRCPSVTELGFRCSKAIPTNWCFSNDDCSYTRTDRQICCPTGCNYNVCVHEDRNPQPIQMYYNLIVSQRLLSPDCPSPFDIPVKC
uniref:WAP domain-containing protein n=1 Tax=Acrobeloides nanus TaxID=290746 RepID=A0A914D3U9_9BILA